MVISNLLLPVDVLKGVGPARKKWLSKLGLETLQDLLWHFPRAYENRGDIKLLKDGAQGYQTSFALTVETAPRTVKLRGGIMLTTFRASDTSGSVEVVFFNQPYVSQQIVPHKSYRFWGRLKYKGGRWQMPSPQYDAIEPNTPLPDLVPRYPLCEGLTQKVLQGYIKDALARCLPFLEDVLDEDTRLQEKLPTLSKALMEVHFPTTAENLSSALRKMMFDELFCMGIGIALSKRSHKETLIPLYPQVDIRPFLEQLPFTLTNAQKRCVREIYHDMTGPNTKGAPMRRMLIGDVGSGKTVCAAAAAFVAVRAGKQVAIMVPTGILATQHYAEFSALFEGLGIRVALLTGHSTAREKQKVYQDLRGDGTHIDIIIGTHALLQKGVVFEDLGLVVTDEQHRFGIMQRANLQEKAECAHVLVMSATPIPRTLALVMYGDLALSKLDEMPPGRQRVDTFVVNHSYRERLHQFIQKQVDMGGQVYIVCPAIEGRIDEDELEEEELALSDFFGRKKESRPPLQNATDYAKKLAEDIFPNLRIALLHGQMKSAEKDLVMQSFSAGEIDILVSTTVIEVGVNVPNACLMIVENAERFGLSQLHQLRGRVGRGKKKSYCVLLSDSQGDAAKARLETMRTCYDGFSIAEQDLAQRGPGDFFASISDGGVRQSGGFSLKMASCLSDTTMMQKAFLEGKKLLEKDPFLTLPEHAFLAQRIRQLFTLEALTIS